MGMKTMPRVVAEIDADLKLWLQWQALSRDTTMQALINEALVEFRDRVGGEIPSTKGKK
jgi:hypothetical protein